MTIRAALERCGHVAVVGGGYIGAEVASAARAVGAAATILDPMPTMLARGIGSHLGSAIAQLHLFGRTDRLAGLVALDGGRAVGPYRRLLAAGASWGDALAA